MLCMLCLQGPEQEVSREHEEKTYLFFLNAGALLCCVELAPDHERHDSPSLLPLRNATQKCVFLK